MVIKYDISIEKLSFKKNVVISNFSTNVEQGDLVGIVGKNGSGKSSLYKIFNHKIPFIGKIGMPREKIGIISDYAKLPKEMYVCDILEFHKPQSVNNTLEALCDVMKIESLMSKKINDANDMKQGGNNFVKIIGFSGG